MTRQGLVQTFDEKAALAELERLRDSIEAARKARRRTSDEFDAFVKSFRKPESTAIPDSPVSTPRLPEVPPPAVSESISGPLQTPESLLVAEPVPPNTDVVDVSTATPVAPLPRRYRVNTRLLGAVTVVAVIGLGVWLTRSRPAISSPPRANPITAAATPNARTLPSAAPQPAPANPAAGGVVIDLRVVRPVWMRVVVDGRKDVEGTVAAGEPLHFTGDRTIVVRVGNGGDVLVKTGSREESFGPVAQPLTRTFSKH